MGFAGKAVTDRWDFAGFVVQVYFHLLVSLELVPAFDPWQVF
jgi:hypothetical protein